MGYKIAIQILFVCVTLRVKLTRTMEDIEDNSIIQSHGSKVNKNSYENPGYNFVLKGKLSSNDENKARPNASTLVHTTLNTTKSVPNFQNQTPSSPSTMTNTEIKRNDEIFSIAHNNVNEKAKDKSNKTDCSQLNERNGNCKNNNETIKAKTTDENRKNGKSKARKPGEKWNPPRNIIGPEQRPTEGIDLSKINIGPEEVYSLQCEQIRKTGRFNPYSMLNEKLFAFYVWGPGDAQKTIEFTVPSTTVFNHIRKHIDKFLDVPVDWNKRHIMFIDHFHNSSAVLVEHNNNGQFSLYPYTKKRNKLSHDWYVQFKQSADGKFLLMAICEMSGAAFLFSRYRDIPTTSQMADVIASMGISARHGKSYLYQGHKWFPIEEMDATEFWATEYGKSRPESITNVPFDEPEEQEPIPTENTPFFPFRLDL